MFPYPRRRRIIRRAIQTRCHALRIADQRFLAGDVLDLSPHGMLTSFDRMAGVGQSLLLSFPFPGTEQWFGAKATVTRIVRGRRDSDRALALGLRFTDIPLGSRIALAELLEGLPPPVPSRPIEPDYAGWIGELIERGESVYFPD